jgi:flagellar basal-body rod modification protein FlgD
MSTIPGSDGADLFAALSGQTGSGQAQPRGQLAQQDFMTLMITQFRNQDPFKPMENGEFLGQLAQFSTVSGIDSLNNAFAGLSASLQSEQALQAASLVGHDVLAVKDVAWLADGGNVAGGVELGSSAGSVQIEITDRNGELVRRLDLGEQPAGLARFAWDGRDENGDVADSGHYLVTARAVRGSNVESVETLIETTIESVSLGQYGEGMTLNLPGGETMPLSQVRRII